MTEEKYKHLPIFNRSPSNIVGETKVDTELYPMLSLWNWYIADKRVASPPRATIRFTRRGKTHKFDMQQNRLVFRLSQIPSLTERIEFVNLPPGELFEHLDKLPRLRFRDGDPFNCTMENITTWVPTFRGAEILHEPSLPADGDDRNPQASIPLPSKPTIKESETPDASANRG